MSRVARARGHCYPGRARRVHIWGSICQAQNSCRVISDSCVWTLRLAARIHVQVLLSFQQPTFHKITKHLYFLDGVSETCSYVFISSESMKSSLLKWLLDHPMKDVESRNTPLQDDQLTTKQVSDSPTESTEARSHKSVPKRCRLKRRNRHWEEPRMGEGPLKSTGPQWEKDFWRGV